MRLLLDTHAWIWFAGPSASLTEKARKTIADPANEIMFSVASAWEISIKYGLGRLRLPGPPESYIPSRVAIMRMTTLPVQVTHACAVHALPPHHGDPFDRMLIAQAIIEGLTIVTADPLFARYNVALLPA